MQKIRVYYYCDECGKRVYPNRKDYNGVQITNDEKSMEFCDDKSYITWIKHWELCGDCYRKFGRDYKKALIYLKANKYDEEDDI